MFVYQYVAVRIPLTEAPYLDPVAQQGFSVVDRHITLLIYSRLCHLRICVACVAIEDSVSWVNNDPELLFLKDQVQKRHHDARNEVQERARES
jgi:hypothetical protein